LGLGNRDLNLLDLWNSNSNKYSRRWIRRLLIEIVCGSSEGPQANYTNMSPKTVRNQLVLEIAHGSKYSAASVAGSVTEITTALMRVAAHKLKI
jgi:hypothetical protein